MLSLLLDESTEDASFWSTYGSLIIMLLLVVVIVVVYVLMSRRSKKREKEAKDLIDAVKPGNKVKTIGGICGIVVEVDAEENTFVLETGTELSGKCYIKFDKQAIYQTDAVIEHKEEGAEDGGTSTEGQAADTPESAEGETSDTTEKSEPAEEERWH